MLDFSKPAEQILNECLDRINAASEKYVIAIRDAADAAAAYDMVKFSLMLDAKSGKADAAMQGVKVTDAVMEAWVKTRESYISAQDVRNAKEVVKWAAAHDLEIANSCLRAALAVIAKDVKLALVQP